MKAEFIHIWRNHCFVNLDNSKDCKKKKQRLVLQVIFFLLKNVGFFPVVIALRCCAALPVRLTAVQVHKM